MKILSALLPLSLAACEPALLADRSSSPAPEAIPVLLQRADAALHAGVAPTPEHTQALATLAAALGPPTARAHAADAAQPSPEITAALAELMRAPGDSATMARVLTRLTEKKPR